MKIRKKTMYFHQWVWQVALIVVSASDMCLGLRDVRLEAPEAVQRGQDVTLRCQYDIEADSLYAVKWYRGDREFYRYSPKERPTVKQFPLPGINVDVASSDGTRLTLSSVGRAAAGRYSCEVSAEAPSFHTALVSAHIHVVEIPGHNPVIKGIKSRYRVGSALKGNCTSRHSLPAANLTWYINDDPAYSSYVRKYHSIEGTDGLHSAISSIHFVVTAKHFKNGKLKVRCTASLYSVYWRSTEKSAEEEKPKERAPPPASQHAHAAHVALVYPVRPAAAQDHTDPNSRSDSSAASRRYAATWGVMAGYCCAIWMTYLTMWLR